MFDFPNNPNVGDIATVPSGPSYEWDGTKWVPAGVPPPFVQLFNGRSGVVTLTKADIDSAGPLDYIPLNRMGNPNGVATLDQFGKVLSSQLPAAATGTLSYKGGWNAATNTPAMTSGAHVGGVLAPKGDYYVVTIGGTTAAIDGITTWVVGDWIVSNGTTWERTQTSSGFSALASMPPSNVAITGGTVSGLSMFGTVQYTVRDDVLLMAPNVPSFVGLTQDANGNYPGMISTDGTLTWFRAAITNLLVTNLQAPSMAIDYITVNQALTVGFLTIVPSGPGLGAPNIPSSQLGIDDGQGNTTARMLTDGTFQWARGYFLNLTVDNLSLSNPLTIGGIELAPEPNNLMPMYPFAEEDTAGNIGRAVTSDGRTTAPLPKAEAMVVNRIKPGYMISVTPPTNGGGASIPAVVGNTYASVWTLEADFDWVRILFHNDRNEGYQIGACTVAPSAQLGDQVHPLDSIGNPIPGVPVTFNNNGQDLPYYAQNSGAATSYTIPAGWRPSGYIGNQYQLVPSDWINVRSLPRSDGGTHPLLFVYTYLLGPRPRILSMGGGGTGNAATPPGQMLGRFFNVATQAGNYTGNYTGFSASPVINQEANISPFGIQVILRSGRGITFMAVGDSIAHGTGGYLNAGWGQHTAIQLSAMARMPVSWWAPWNGAGADDFMMNARQIMPLIKPNVCVLELWSQNLSNAPDWTQDDADREYRAAMDTALFVERYGGVPILMSCPPLATTTSTTEPYRYSAVQRGLIAEASGMVYMNWDPIIGDGAFPPRQLPGLSSGGLGIHPNDEGHALFTAALLKKLRRMLDI